MTYEWTAFAVIEAAKKVQSARLYYMKLQRKSRKLGSPTRHAFAVRRALAELDRAIDELILALLITDEQTRKMALLGLKYAGQEAIVRMILVMKRTDSALLRLELMTTLPILGWRDAETVIQAIAEVALDHPVVANKNAFVAADAYLKAKDQARETRYPCRSSRVSDCGAQGESDSRREPLSSPARHLRSSRHGRSRNLALRDRSRFPSSLECLAKACRATT